MFRRQRRKALERVMFTGLTSPVSSATLQSNVEPMLPSALFHAHSEPARHGSLRVSHIWGGRLIAMAIPQIGLISVREHRGPDPGTEWRSAQKFWSAKTSIGHTRG
jgi:hypothetical protein